MILSISIVFAVAAFFFIVVIIRSRLRFVEEMEKSWAEYRKTEQVLREQYAALNSPPERDKIHEVIGYDS
jgi:uncharacterized membrane protein